MLSLVTAHEVTSAICKEGFVLVIKENTSEASCMSLETANAIVKRGWGTIAEEISPTTSSSVTLESFPETPIYISSEQGDQVSVGTGVDSIVKITSSETDGVFELFEVIAQPSSGPPRHIHYDQIEIFRILEGEFEFLAGDSLIKASVGDIVIVPNNTIHAFTNLGDAPGRLSFVILPGHYNLGEYFYILEEYVQTDDWPSPETIKELSDEYNTEMVGPPLNKEQ